MSATLKVVLAAVFVTAVTADVSSKYAVAANLNYMDSIPVIDGFFHIVYVLNPGAAFGFMRNMDDSYRQIFFVVVTLIAIAAVFYLLTREKRSFPAVAYVLVLAGAVGNLIDRIRTGLVVDFLDFQLTPTYHWPAFNIADTCITIGIAMLLADVVFNKKHRVNSAGNGEVRV